MNRKSIAKFFAAAIAGGVLLMACNNNTDPAPLPVPVQNLIQNDWKITDITVPKVTEPGGDSSIRKDCTADDIIKFYITGTYDFQDGTVKCDSSIFSYSKGYWGYDLTKDSVQIAMISPASRYVSWKVITLNDSVLKVTYIDSLDVANKITKTISFKK
jgi:hypothetical protein